MNNYITITLTSDDTDFIYHVPYIPSQDDFYDISDENAENFHLEGVSCNDNNTYSISASYVNGSKRVSGVHIDLYETVSLDDEECDESGVS